MSADFFIRGDTKLDTKGFEGAVGKLGSVAKKGLGVIAGATTAAVSAIGTLGVYSIKVGSDFEAAMSEVQAISGATGEDLEKLTAAAQEMGATTKFSATESAEALKYMAMAGWDTQKMLDGLPGIINLAAASGESLGAVSDIVTDSMTAFGLSADQAAHFSDVLAQASNKSNTNVSMLGDSFKYVAPVAGALGFSIEDTAVALGLMANSGIKAGQAGTSLRALLSNLTHPVGQAKDAINDLNISLENSDGSVKSLSEVMSDLREKFGGMTEAEKAQYAAMLAGQEGMSGLLAIVNTSNADFQSLTNSIYSSNGAAEKMAETMQDNLQGSLTNLKSAAEGFGIAIYEGIQGPAKDIVDVATGWVREVTATLQNEGLPAVIDAAGQILAEATTMLVQSIPSFVETAVALMTAFVDGIVQALPQLLPAAAQILQALVSGLIRLAPTVFSALQQIGSMILSAIQSILPNVTSGVATFLQTMLPQLLSFTGSLREKVGELVDIGLQLIQNLWSGIVQSLPVLIQNVPQIITNIAGIINDNFPKILATGLSMMWELLKGLIAAIPDIIAALPQIIEAIVAVFMAFNWVSLGNNIITMLKNGIVAMKGAAGQAAKSIFETVKNIIANLPTTLKNLGSSAISFLSNGITGMLGIVKHAASSILSGIINTIAALPSRLLSIAQNAISSVWNAFISSDWGSIGANVINGIIGGIGSALGGLVNAAVNAARSAFEAAKNFLGIHSPSRLFRDQIGKMIPQGMAIGVEAETDKAVSSVELSAQAMLDKARAALYANNVPGSSLALAGSGVGSAVNVNAALQTNHTTIVELDGRTVGKVIAPYVDEFLF